MPEFLFQHERVNGGHPLVINTGADEVSWGYALNVAKIPTYGGEVIQILSAYIEDMSISGTVPTYAIAEEIYSFFMEYFIIATQGSTENSQVHFEQVPMIMTYPHRNWRFEIQPLQAPGFTYSKETVAPKWALKAHVVDRGQAVERLKNMVVNELFISGNQEVAEPGHTGQFKLTGEISPDSGNPEDNPFIAPGTTSGTRFEPYAAKEITEGLGKIADYYSTLLPSYMKGDFSDITSAVGAKPIFGRPTKKGEENPEEILKSTVTPKGT